jgi:hypothetical protein
MMLSYLKDLKSLITLILTLALVVATFMGLLSAQDALVPITLMVFTYYFTKKDTPDSTETTTKTETTESTTPTNV